MTATTTFLVGLFAGIFIGAAGEYYALLFTDRRRHKEHAAAARVRFSRTKNMMPELLDEMSADLTKHPAQRDLTFLPNRKVGLRTERFRYHEDEHPDLRGKLATLENRGYISVVNELSDGTPVYRMSEDFVERLTT